MSTLITLIVAAVTFGTVLMYGTLGEILTEKAGTVTVSVAVDSSAVGGVLAEHMISGIR